MRVAVAGSQGLIGNALVESLRADGHDVVRLVRRESLSADEFSWAPETFGVPPESLEGVDAVVGLGGVGVGDQRWSGRFKQALRDSRITPTTVLSEAVAHADIPTFVSASATGFYGDTGEHAATESDAAGDGFLAGLVVDWESAARGGVDESTRLVLLRTAPVLAPRGGLLSRLRPIFKLGLGGPIGDGHQYFSWITLTDEVRAIRYLLDGAGTDIVGPVNLTAPDPVPFREFTAEFGRAVHRPTIFSVPAFAARTVGGEMAEEMILASQRVVPEVLTEHGFTFTHPDISTGLRYATN
ncbi:TIGR01777 family oxidoreductase [Gordonia soli]|uniref:TIGR01777 family protein n=1 Tax=Gordonia soli NBRC 108243 TaxID=1223545 RepID=M0QLR0_9ACTN|nr:TIGR01777 family oxidoreductase [Gordonia soli]GAC69498.1 hypothetical protein GS4_25_00690 [Gordonia soli NBRC 108243]